MEKVNIYNGLLKTFMVVLVKLQMRIVNETLGYSNLIIEIRSTHEACQNCKYPSTRYELIM